MQNRSQSGQSIKIKKHNPGPPRDLYGIGRNSFPAFASIRVEEWKLDSRKLCTLQLLREFRLLKLEVPKKYSTSLIQAHHEWPLVSIVELELPLSQVVSSKPGEPITSTRRASLGKRKWRLDLDHSKHRLA